MNQNESVESAAELPQPVRNLPVHEALVMNVSDYHRKYHRQTAQSHDYDDINTWNKRTKYYNPHETLCFANFYTMKLGKSSL